jgi:hypothetical protein
MKNTIKYQYAEDSSGKIVHINSTNKDNRKEKYFCIDCKQELIARLGNERVHHFAHKVDFFNCSEETYLHKLGKRIFYETYLQCLNSNEPFYICTLLFNSLSFTCKYNDITESKNCIKNGINKFNLTTCYKNIEFEKKQGDFTPDITLSNNYGDRIFIEIAVTHPCEKEKIESKNKIIEISVKNETDLEIILKKSIPEENEKVKIYNFDEFNEFVEPFCDENIKSNYVIITKDKIQHLVTKKSELCKYIYENKDNISSIRRQKSITLKRHSHNYSGPLINEIESSVNRKNYYGKGNKFKRRRK